VVGWICGACFVDITFFFFISPRLFVLPLVHDAYEPSPSRPAITPPLVYPYIICISVYRRIIASPSLPRFIVHQSFPVLFFFHLHRGSSTSYLVTTNPPLLRFSITTHNFFPLFFLCIGIINVCFQLHARLNQEVDILATGGEMAYLMIKLSPHESNNIISKCDTSR
jgi:hypothetical protein